MYYFKYVRHGQIKEYLDKGWIVIVPPFEMHFDQHCVLMWWPFKIGK